MDKEHAIITLRTEYIKLKPPPAKVRLGGFSPERILLILGIVAALIVSGSRTYPTFANMASVKGIWAHLVGISAFIMVEAFIIVSTYQYIKDNALRTRKPVSNKINYRVGITVAIVTALTGNIHDVLVQSNVISSQIMQALNMWTSLTIAVSPVVMVYISGEVLAAMVVNADLLYEQEHAAWNDGFLEYANPQRISAALRTAKKELNTGRTRTDTDKRYIPTRTDKRTIVRNWLLDNEDKQELTVRVLADVISQDTGIDVQKTLVADVKKEIF